MAARKTFFFWTETAYSRTEIVRSPHSNQCKTENIFRVQSQLTDGQKVPCGESFAIYGWRSFSAGSAQRTEIQETKVFLNHPTHGRGQTLVLSDFEISDVKPKANSMYNCAAEVTGNAFIDKRTHAHAHTLARTHTHT